MQKLIVKDKNNKTRIVTIPSYNTGIGWDSGGGGQLEWSPSFGAYITWNNGIAFTGDQYVMSYDEFGSVDNTSVVSVVFVGDSFYRFGQFSSIYGFNHYPNLRYLELDSNRNLKSLDLSSVNNLKYFYTNGVDLSDGINFSNQFQLEHINVVNTDVNSITLHEQPNITWIQIIDNLKLESINIPGSGSTGHIRIYDNEHLNLITVPLNAATYLELYGNALTNVNVSVSPLLVTLDVSDNFLTSLNFNGCPYLKHIYAGNNIFSTATVDNLFISASNAADTYNLTYGHMNLSGSNGLPSLASSASRANLTSRNWSVQFAQYDTLYTSSNSTDPNVAAWTYTTASNGAGDETYSSVYYISGTSTFATPNIKTLSLDGLSEIDGVFHMDGVYYMRGTAATRQTLESVNFNNLPNMCSLNGGNLYINSCGKLTSINVTGCTSVIWAGLNYNPRLTSINLSGSTNITTLNVDGDYELTTLDLSQLPNLQRFDGFYTAGITSYDFTNNTSLTRIGIGGDRQRSNLESIDCSGLSSLTYLDLDSHPKLTSLNLSGSNALETIDVSLGCGLTTIDLSAQTSLETIDGSDSKFSSIDLPLTNTLTYVNLSRNQLTAGEVNKVLHLLASGSASSGFVSLYGAFISGVIQNGIPDTTSGGYDGIAAKATLISRGWTVTTNT